jgi:hypothetical protein
MAQRQRGELVGPASEEFFRSESACSKMDQTGKNPLKKGFVYQSTKKHDELKTPCFQRGGGVRV